MKKESLDFSFTLFFSFSFLFYILFFMKEAWLLSMDMWFTSRTLTLHATATSVQDGSNYLLLA